MEMNNLFYLFFNIYLNDQTVYINVPYCPIPWDVQENLPITIYNVYFGMTKISYYRQISFIFINKSTSSRLAGDKVSLFHV